MNSNFSDRMMTLLEYVKEEALRLGDETIGVEHLILGIIREGEGTAVRTLNALGLDIKDLRKIIEQVVSIRRSNYNFLDVKNVLKGIEEKEGVAASLVDITITSICVFDLKYLSILASYPKVEVVAPILEGRVLSLVKQIIFFSFP